jgi:hypothetical protein
MTAQAEPTPSVSVAALAPKAVVSPWFDGLAIGGLSIVVMVAILAVFPSWHGGTTLEPPLRPLLDNVSEAFIVFTALLNWPHFLATYVMVYRSKESVMKYPVATIWMPLLLGLYCAGATIAGAWTPIPARLAAFAAGSYLAWHYTGQQWGMIATYTYLSNKTMPDQARVNLRRSLRFLVAFHVGWFIYYLEPFGITEYVGHERMRALYLAYSAAVGLVAAAFGVVGTRAYIRANGNMPGRVAVAWGAIWVWYIFMFIHPIGIFWVQLSHSLQYLIFPARIELNRASARGSRWPAWAITAVWAVAVIGAGLFVFRGGPFIVGLLNSGAGSTAGAAGRSIIDPGIAFLSLGAFINIHHFFADSVIWRISNPHVRKDLFSHLKR